MKITEVVTIALGGATHDHGWPGGTDPNVQYNTLVEVRSEDGLSGIGSCYTTRALVEGSLELLRPHLIGENGLEPDRVAEKLRQSMFWLGRGGSVEHTISGIDIALWDLCGKALGSRSGACWVAFIATGSSRMRRCCSKIHRYCARNCSSSGPTGFEPSSSAGGPSVESAGSSTKC